MITANELRQRLHYDPITGIFTWINSRRKGWNGKVAGWTDADGYIFIKIGDRLEPAHRLAYLYMMGEWPPSGFVDHKNVTPSDNRWENLRDATKKMNQENRRKAGRNNKAGLLGVSPNGKRWAATINTTEDGKRQHHYLGTFDTPAEAHNEYVKAKRRLHEGCTI